MQNKLDMFVDDKFIIHIIGELNLNNCMLLKNRFATFVIKPDRININLKQIKNYDSSAALFIIGVLRSYKTKRVKFINVPTSLKIIMDSYKIGCML